MFAAAIATEGFAVVARWIASSKVTGIGGGEAVCAHTPLAITSTSPTAPAASEVGRPRGARSAAPMIAAPKRVDPERAS